VSGAAEESTVAPVTVAPGTVPPGTDLFGRGMIYVVVWSMQLAVGTLVSPVLAHLIPMAGFGALSAAIALFQLLIVFTV